MTSMNRHSFLEATSAAAVSSLLGGCATPRVTDDARVSITFSGHRLTRPLAIAMWDFSWLERRWPGAG